MKNYDQAAAYLGITHRHLRELVARKQIGVHRIGRAVRFSEADLDRFLASTRVEPEQANPLLANVTPLRARRQ